MPEAFYRSARAFAAELSKKHNIPLATVESLRPQDPHDPSPGELENFADKWHAAVEMKSAQRRINSVECDKKRLAHFRRRYGPTITPDHLPKGRV